MTGDNNQCTLISTATILTGESKRFEPMYLNFYNNFWSSINNFQKGETNIATIVVWLFVQDVQVRHPILFQVSVPFLFQVRDPFLCQVPLKFRAGGSAPAPGISNFLQVSGVSQTSSRYLDFLADYPAMPSVFVCWQSAINLKF